MRTTSRGCRLEEERGEEEGEGEGVEGWWTFYLSTNTCMQRDEIPTTQYTPIRNIKRRIQTTVFLFNLFRPSLFPEASVF